MAEYLRLPFLSGMTIEAGEPSTEQNPIAQHTTDPLAADEEVPEKTNSQADVEVEDPKIVAIRVRKAQAAAKRKAERKKGSEGAGGSGRGSKRRKPSTGLRDEESTGAEEGGLERSPSPILCPTPIRTVAVINSEGPGGDNVIASAEHQGDNVLVVPEHDSANTTFLAADEDSGIIGDKSDHFDDDVDEEIDLEQVERRVNDTSERVLNETEPVTATTTRPDTGKSVAHEETPLSDPLTQGMSL